LGHISANGNDLDCAGSAGFQPAWGPKSPLLTGPQLPLTPGLYSKRDRGAKQLAISGREWGTPTGCPTPAVSRPAARRKLRSSPGWSPRPRIPW